MDARCDFTLAEARTGIEIPFRVIADQDLPGVSTSRCCASRDAGGVFFRQTVLRAEGRRTIERYDPCSDEGEIIDAFCCPQTTDLGAGPHEGTVFWRLTSEPGPETDAGRSAAKRPSSTRAATWIA